MIFYTKNGIIYKTVENGIVIRIVFQTKAWKDRLIHKFVKALGDHIAVTVQSLAPEMKDLKVFAFGEPVDYYESVKDALIVAKNLDGTFTVKPGR